MNEPQPFPPTPPPAKPENNLSIVSLVLGILSLACLGFLSGIPAIITGHMAYNRSKKDPARYGSAGTALAGLVLGYIGTALTTIALIAFAGALLLPALARAKGKAQTVQCVNNMKQIGLAARIWSNDHNESFPPDLVSMSNELVRPNILVCPGDKSKSPAADWSQFDPAQHSSYEFLTPGAKEAEVIQQVTFQCPVHGNVGMGDGSVQQQSGNRRRRN
jgi:hypothetical protein